MNKVAYLLDGQFIYWRSIIIALAVVTAILMAVSLRLGQRHQRLGPLLISLPFAITFSLYASRWVHWYCRFESYTSLRDALTDFSGGGWSLMGVFSGTIAAMVLMRLLQLTKNLPALLDAVSPAAALGIAVGRLSEYFSSANRGKVIFENEALLKIPYSAPAVNATSGVTEWRFATFFAQSAWAAFLFVVLFLRLILPVRRKPARDQWRYGEVFLLFMTLYCLGQVLLDSTRYDALFLRSNGFVSLEQIVCGVVLLAILALYSVRSILVRRFHYWHPLLWLLALVGLGLAGFMEYYVQRHGDAYVFSYGMMADGLLIFFCAVLAMKHTTLLPKSKKAPAPEPEAPAAEELEPENPAEEVTV